MAMEPAELHARLKALISAWTPFEGRGQVSQEALLWLGRMHALVVEADNGSDQIVFGVAMQGIGTALHEINTAQLKAIIFKTLAAAEMKAPAAQQGSFIATASPFQVFAALAKIMASAKREVLIVDPYVDAVSLTDVASSAAEGIQIQILGDSVKVQPNLAPAVTRWKAQYSARPLDVRMATARALHDRLVVVDQSEVWNLSQSIKDFANRSNASIERSNAELSAEKVTAYLALWATATPLP